jgi:trk system potassium uptake protein TrkA
MKVIICGAGQVGYNIARYLSDETNSITIIDQRPELIKKVSEGLDVQAIQGHASHPDVLERAGAADADMLIAVTHADEVNMVACQIAHSLFNVPTKIARVRNQAYLQPAWANLFTRDHMPIDVIISPEIEVAKAMNRRLQVPGASEVIPLAHDKVQLIGVRCNSQTPVVNTPIRQLTALFPELNIVVVGILRDEKAIVPSPDDQIMEGDEVFVVVATDQVRRVLSAFGHEEEESRRVLIYGGGNIGMFLGQMLEQSPNVHAKIIEMNQDQAEYAARTLTKTIVLNGDVLDPEILEEANVDSAGTVVAVTDDDETNILASLLSKRKGAQRTITLVNKSTYTPLISTLGVDVIVNPRSITVSTILQHVRRGRIHAVHSLHEGFGELIEADALETSPIVGKPLKEVRLPNGVLLGAIVRGEEVISPRGSTIVAPGDRVVLFSSAECIKKVEKMFSVRLEFI